MNRNVESHFSMLPSANISRSRFDRSQDVKLTADAGLLIPFYVDEVLPGDTFDITTSKVVRMQTLLRPILDNLYADFYWFYVPNRLLHTHWREIMGENTQSAWIPEVEYSVPQITFVDTEVSDLTKCSVQVGDILDYMGVPVGVASAYGTDTADVASVSAYPLRAYQLIWNEFFRSEAIQDPVNIQTGDSNIDYKTLEAAGLTKPLPVCKYFDYFTSCLPSPQKGPPVKVEAGFTSRTKVGDNYYELGWPVQPRGIWSDSSYTPFEITPGSGNAFATTVRDMAGNKFTNRTFLDVGKGADPTTVAADGNVFVAQNPTVANAYATSYLSNLFAYPASNTESGVFLDINDLRYAFQLQKLYERDARGGTRYRELLASHFGVSNGDARLQVPEYLGGNRVGVSIHQVTNQSQGESDFLGDLGAMSLTTDKHRDFVKSFTEHGLVLGLMCFRYDHSYPQGLEKFWTRKSRFDYYWPVFANLGEEAVKRSSIYWTGDKSSDDQVFGYQERWADYRYKPNRVAGEMRPGISNTLDSWHLADYYTEAPTLSEGWIAEDKTTVDRVLAVTSAVSNQFFADIYVKNYTTRPMPLYSIPGLIDHH